MRLRTSWLARLLRGRRLDGTRWGYDSAAPSPGTAGQPGHGHAAAGLTRVTSYGSTSGFTVEARWRAPDGPVQTGELFVTADVAAGHSTRIWVDRAGRLTGPPLNRDQMTGRAQLAAGVAVGGLAAVLITAGWLVRRSLDRRRLSGWDAEWLANAPRWSPRR